MPELKAVVAVYHARDRMKYWSKLGVFWGSIWGFLSGTVFFAVAGTGQSSSRDLSWRRS
jgi:hypothetical protein